MNSLKEIRERDAASAATWFKEPALGACGRAFIDRRWLLEELTQLRAQEVKGLRDALEYIKRHSDGKSAAWSIADHALRVSEPQTDGT